MTEEDEEAAAAPSGRPSQPPALAVDVQCWGPAFLSGAPLILGFAGTTLYAIQRF
jgi:hypothetical protein